MALIRVDDPFAGAGAMLFNTWKGGCCRSCNFTLLLLSLHFETAGFAAASDLSGWNFQHRQAVKVIIS
jgi:hypothetical protein